MGVTDEVNDIFSNALLISQSRIDAGDIRVITRISEETGIQNAAFKDPATAINVTFVTFKRLPGGIDTTIE